MALKDLGQAWHSYDETHMNEHMAEHTVTGRKHAFTGYDLEMTYLLGHSSSDFQAICQNRIIRGGEDFIEGTGRKLGNVVGFKNIYDVFPIPWHDLCYQAQNLVYMYSLGLVDTLDKDLVASTYNTTVRNSGRVGRRLDGDIPVFRSLIGMHEVITLDEVEDVRTDYLGKKPLAEEILEAGKKYGLKLNDTVLRGELASA